MKLQYDLNEFSVKMRDKADEYYDSALINDNTNESRLEHQFSVVLLNLSNELKQIINSHYYK